MKDAKPLGGKAYGSIPHLPGSRLGPADHHCHKGQETICLEKPRDRHDRIIVTEKLDGACVSIARINGELVPLVRAGYRADSSPHYQLQMFHKWAQENSDFFAPLEEGQRICGEWIALAHGTKYRDVKIPFIPFDLISLRARLPHDSMVEFCRKVGLRNANVISDGLPISIESALVQAGEFGDHGATDPIEGMVWRVERKGAFDFMAKYVRPSKVDGRYLNDITGHPVTWNWVAQS